MAQYMLFLWKFSFTPSNYRPCKLYKGRFVFTFSVCMSTGYWGGIWVKSKIQKCTAQVHDQRWAYESEICSVCV